MITEELVQELPPYRAVVAVDVKNFGGVKGVDHHELTEKIPIVLERAFERAGYPAIWKERRFPAGRGDGYVVGFRPEVLPVLLGPMVDSLQDELADHHQGQTGNGPDVLRMRVSIGVGPLTDSDAGRLGDGSGDAMVETHRLLDSEPVRNLLEDSDPSITFVAVVVSSRVFDDVVASGYATKSASEFTAVPIHVKTYEGTAFLHVPKPSGGLLSSGCDTETTPTIGMAEGDRGTVNNSMSGRVGGHIVQSRDLNLGGNLVLGDSRT